MQNCTMYISQKQHAHHTQTSSDYSKLRHKGTKYNITRHKNFTCNFKQSSIQIMRVYQSTDVTRKCDSVLNTCSQLEQHRRRRLSVQPYHFWTRQLRHRGPLPCFHIYCRQDSRGRASR